MSVCLNVAESINTKCNYNFRMDATYIMRKQKKENQRKTYKILAVISMKKMKRCINYFITFCYLVLTRKFYESLSATLTTASYEL